MIASFAVCFVFQISLEYRESLIIFFSGNPTIFFGRGILNYQIPFLAIRNGRLLSPRSFPSSPPPQPPLKRKILPLRWKMSSIGCRAVQVYFRQVDFSKEMGAILPSLESRLHFYLWKRHSFITFLTHIHILKALLFLKYAKRLWNRSILKSSRRFVLLYVYLMFHPVSPDLLTTA